MTADSGMFEFRRLLNLERKTVQKWDLDFKQAEENEAMDVDDVVNEDDDTEMDDQEAHEQEPNANIWDWDDMLESRVVILFLWLRSWVSGFEQILWLWVY